MNEKMNGWMDDGCPDGKTDGPTNERTNESTNERTNERMNEFAYFTRIQSNLPERPPLLGHHHYYKIFNRWSLRRSSTVSHTKSH